MIPSASELIVNAQSIKARLRFPPNAVPDTPINLKRLPKGFYFIGERPKPMPKFIPIIAVECAEAVQVVVKPRKPTIQSIIRRVADYYNLTRADILDHGRRRTIVRPRQVAVYLCREVLPRLYIWAPMMVCGWSMPALGRKFGGRDHSTIHHAYHTIAAMILTDADLAWDVAHLEAELTSGHT